MWEWITSWFSADAVSADPFGGFDASAIAGADYSDAIAVGTAAEVDWNAVGSAWEGAVAESAAQNAELAGSWLNYLEPLKSVGTSLLSAGLSKLDSANKAQTATAPTAVARTGVSGPGTPWLTAPGAPGGAITQGQVVTLAALAVGAVVLFKTMGK